MCNNSTDDQSIAPSVDSVDYTTVISNASSSVSSSVPSIQNIPSGTNTIHSRDFVFRSKSLHMANLNIHHLLSKLNELRISMACEKGPDVLGIFETTLDNNISGNVLTVNGFDHIRKDRSVMQEKSGGGVILYFRNNINCNIVNNSNYQDLVAGDWDCVAAVERFPALHYSEVLFSCPLGSWVSLWNFETIRGSLMKHIWQKLASLAQKIGTL